jgi:hypothetical protein
MQERAVSANVDPVLVTNTRGKWVQTRVFAPGLVRCGIYACPVTEEDAALSRLLSAIQEKGWENRCTSIQAALTKMRSVGARPRSIVISKEDLKDIGVDLETAENLMKYQGYVTVQEGIQTLVGTMPSGHSLVVAHQAGLYVRVDDFLGLMAFGANRNFCVVTP